MSCIRSCLVIVVSHVLLNVFKYMHERVESFTKVLV